MGKKSNPSGATPSIHERLVELLSRLGDRAIAEKEARHIVRLRVEDFHYHSDDISRKALLQHDEEPQTVVSDNVIALAS